MGLFSPAHPTDAWLDQDLQDLEGQVNTSDLLSSSDPSRSISALCHGELFCWFCFQERVNMVCNSACVGGMCQSNISVDDRSQVFPAEDATATDWPIEHSGVPQVISAQTPNHPYNLGFSVYFNSFSFSTNIITIWLSSFHQLFCSLCCSKALTAFTPPIQLIALLGSCSEEASLSSEHDLLLWRSSWILFLPCSYQKATYFHSILRDSVVSSLSFQLHCSS